MKDFKNVLSGEKQPRRRLPAEVILAMTGRLAELEKAEECVFRSMLPESAPQQVPGAAFAPSTAALTEQHAPAIADLNRYRQEMAEQDDRDAKLQAARTDLNNVQAIQPQYQDDSLEGLGYSHAA